MDSNLLELTLQNKNQKHFPRWNSERVLGPDIHLLADVITIVTSYR